MLRVVQFTLISAVAFAFFVPAAVAGDSVSAGAPVSTSDGMPEDQGGNASQNEEELPKRSLHLIKLEPRLDTFESQTRAKRHSAQGKARPVQLSGGVVEKNLAIEWDDWHNNLAQAIRHHMFSNVVETLNIPPGARMWFRCVVTSDRHIKSVNIVRPSGDFWYDRAVINAVHKLEGNGVLTFPAASKRTEVSTDFAIIMGGKDRGYLRFGDVEYRELGPNENVPNEQGAPKTADSSENHKPVHHKLHLF